MVDDQQFARVLSQAINDSVIAVQPIGVAYGSNRVYKLKTASGQRYVVKVPKQVRETMSPFWQHLDAIFGINSITQNTAFHSVSTRLQQQTILSVPQVIHIEPESTLLGAPYAIMTYLDGTSHEPDEFPASTEIQYQLGQYIGYLHTQEYVGYGNVLMAPLQPKADFFATIVASMRRTLQTFWVDQTELHSYFDRLTTTTDSETIFSTANLIMVDISANQFVYGTNRTIGTLYATGNSFCLITMHKPTTVILITGHPATGKTTLARCLAPELGLPLLCRDSFKEKLADTLGWSTEEWSLKLGAATWELLYDLVESLLRAQVSHLVESNFSPSYATPRWQQLRERYPLRIIQLRCEAEPEIVIARHHARVQQGERHPIHRYDSDGSGYLSFLQQGPMGWIEVESTRIVVDTGRLQPSDYGAIATQIREILKERTL